MDAREKNTAQATVGTYDQIQRACAVFGLTHSTDGNISIYRDHLPRLLSSVVNLAAKVLGGNTPLRVDSYRPHGGVIELPSIIKALRDCEKLGSYRDLVFIPAVAALVEDLPHEKVLGMLHSLSSERGGQARELNELLDGLYKEGLRARVSERSVAWQNQAKGTWRSIKSCVDSVFSPQVPLVALKVDLPLKSFAPIDKMQAAVRYDDLMQGKRLAHPTITQVQSNLHAFHGALREVLPEHKLRGWVYLISFSRISGPYTTAVLLFDGEGESSSEALASIVQNCWASVTKDDGFCYCWPPEECAWAGRITSDDESKRAALSLGLECVVLAEQFVRPRCLSSMPTFVFGAETNLNIEISHE